MTQLTPGVIVPLEKDFVYFSDPEGGIRAHDITKRDHAWQTKDARLPLAVAGSRLIGQAPVADLPELPRDRGAGPEDREKAVQQARTVVGLPAVGTPGPFPARNST